MGSRVARAVGTTDRLLLFNLVTDVDDPIFGFTSEWIRAVADRVVGVDVVTMRKGRLVLPSNVAVYSLGKERGYSEPRRALEFYRVVRNLLRANSYVGCFVHMVPLFAAMAGPLLHRAGVPVVLWYATGEKLRSLRIAAPFCSPIVTSSRPSFPGTHKRLVVIGQGIDTSFFLPADSPPADPVAITVGRVTSEKRIDLIIEAISLARREHPELTLRVVGPASDPKDPVYLSELEKRVHAGGLEGVVEFTGPVTHSDMPAVYNAATISVNASASNSLDKAVLESMSCGVPCVGTNRSVGELVAPASPRLHAAPTPRALADAINEVLSLSEGDRRRLGADLREIVVANHSLDRLPEKIVCLIEERPERLRSRSLGYEEASR